jgi:small GTP-binding protein
MDNEISLKVVLVGEAGIGKTCIIQRYINNVYNDSTASSDTATYTNKKIKIGDKTLSLDIWDTAGQELYRAMSKNFYLNASVGILVYDITRRQSFEELKNYWYDQLKTSGEENIIFGVAGNKCDLFSEEQVKEKEAKKFAEEIEGVFCLTSCKDNIGIENLFEECGKKYLQKNNIITTTNKPTSNFTLDDKNLKKNDGNNKKKCCL